MASVTDELAAVKKNLDDIGTGVANLNQQIQNFKNNTSSTLNSTDQAALDAIATEAAALDTQANPPATP